MNNTHELKRHISGVEDTIKITRAMQMIATSKLYRAREKCENSYRYLKELRNILSAAAAHESVREHPFLREHKAERPPSSSSRATRDYAVISTIVF